MTNKQIIVLREIKRILKDDTDAQFVGYYPDDVNEIGNRYYACLVQDGDEITDTNSGRRTNTEWTVSVWFYTNVVKNRIEAVLDIQTAIMDAVLDNQSLGGKCVQIQPVDIEKGDYASDLDEYSPGFYSPMTIRKINFTIRIDDVR